MEQTIVLLLSATLNLFGFGQRHAVRSQHTINPIAAKTTAVGDTLSLTNINASDTLTIYSYGADSGYVTGPNVYGDRGFAERYDINGHDSSVKIIGVMSHFGGRVSASSTQTVNFKIWGLGPQIAITASLAYNNFPLTGLDTVTVPVTQLGIGTTVDTVKSFFFTRPTDTIQGAFFVGYDMNYSFSTMTDTFGLYSTKNGARTGPWYEIKTNIDDFTNDTTYDTVINVQNATLWSDNSWHENFTQNDSIKNNLAIYPIVIIGQPTGINSITRNNLTFFGNYPNPANGHTNIRFSLSKNADVTVTVMDMQGRTIKSQQYKAQGIGEHIVDLSTAELISGTYIYSIITSNGDAIASQMSVIK